MPATSRAATDAPDASDAAASLREAPLARLVVRRDGDAVAAASVLARALRQIDVPVQVSPTATEQARIERVDAGDPKAVTVAIGPVAGADVALGGEDRPVSIATAEIARELGVEPDAELALAGVVAAGELPADVAPALLERAKANGLERRDGVGIATDDLVDGIAHSLAFHATFSGNTEATATALDGIGIDGDVRETVAGDEHRALTDEQRRSIASLVAVAGTESDAPEAAADSIERVIRPHRLAGPVPTLEGYADLLSTTAVVEPGLAVAHAIGDLAVDTLESSWRAASVATHGALADADPARYDGVAVYDAEDASPEIVAALARDALSPEPVALAIGTDAIGLASRDSDAPDLVGALADAAGGDADVTTRYAVVREPTNVTETALVEAIREA
ncbi:RecJ-like exonuclease [Salinarchaeum sp. Harcht-Bsk1]|uniref:hypothetical protein n=1 Tax=Salinarchaeum sp. Harcht-Bsk1 TaxID=1333523 RepID=UPI0003422CFA|nr:hypothetical protein [Salinarchaeum sp. Harcht-Bsk1]AGN02668.1 RecJ-like exonuclease [Salinarchaeum sp. Harcht-Bsk1]